MLLGHRRIEAALELEQLALRHAADRVREDPEDVEVAVLDDHRRGPGVQEVAGQHGATVAPDRVGGGTPATQLGEIDDVIVEQGRGVEQLDRGTDLDAARSGVAAQLGAEQQQGRAQPLATGAEHVLAHQRDDLALGRELLPHRALDQGEVVANAVESCRKGRIELRHVAEPTYAVQP